MCEAVKDIKLKRALTVNNLLEKKYKLIDWSPTWQDAFASPELAGTWIVWGASGNGKTGFVLQLVKELARNNKVILNSLEEGTAHSMQTNFKRVGMGEVANNVLLITEDCESMIRRLEKKKSPDIVVIDSFQYLQINYKQYLDLKTRLSNKLLIFVSHADGKFPAGRSAKSVMFDATLKILVEGYVAFSKGRYIGEKGKYTIWEQGALNYWGQI